MNNLGFAPGIFASNAVEQAPDPIIEQEENINLVKELPEDVLKNIASYLQERIKEDKASREPWLKAINEIKPYLGFSLEKLENTADINELVTEITKYNFQTFDSTLSTCVFKLWCIIRGQILPRLGPVGINKNVSNAADLEQMGNFVRDELNKHLTEIDKGFYQDYERFILYLIFYGSVTRKIYNDPFLNKPITRFILPENFLVDNNCQSINDSNRLTHILFLSKREIILNVRSGYFIDPELTYINNNSFGSEDEQESTTLDLSVYTNKSIYEFHETHVYLDLKEFFTNEINAGIMKVSELPCPYIVTRCVSNNKIVSIIPNWESEDKLRKRIDCFIHYKLFPSFDIYSYGFAQLLGNNGVAQTKIQRMTIDAAIHQNFPGGVYSSGAEMTNNNINSIPGTYIPLDSGLHSLKDSIMPFPFPGPSPAMMTIADRITEQMRQLSGTTELISQDVPQNAPVGTTLATLEENNRLQSTILQSVHNCFSEEVQLLYKNFGFPENYYEILEDSLITLASDPSLESTTQKIVKAETVMKMAASNPELHNMYYVYKNMYEALGIDDTDNILYSPEAMEEKNAAMAANQQQPLDPGVIEMADIQQREAEVQSRERIAHMRLEGDGYKTQMDLELQQQKQEAERKNAELKVDLELQKLRVKEAEDEAKQQIELLKLEQNSKEQELRNTIAQLESVINSQVNIGE